MQINGGVFGTDAFENDLVILVVEGGQWICTQDIYFVSFG
jgi:hypothetical protein